jgi:hypothetical protein
MPCYLVHLDPPLKHARHYLGFCEHRPGMTVAESVATRLEYHQRGQGSRLLRAAVQAGCVLQVVRIWDSGTRDQERKLKCQASTPYCPICNARWETNGVL